MFLVLAGFILIALIDLIPMFRQHSKNQIIAFFTFFCPAFAIALLVQLNIEVPSLLLLLDGLFKAVGLSY